MNLSNDGIEFIISTFQQKLVVTDATVELYEKNTYINS